MPPQMPPQMGTPLIAKPRPDAANLVDYEAARRAFSWAAVRRELGVSGDRLNIAEVALDRQLAGGGADRAALRWARLDGRVETISYGQLAARSRAFAGALAQLGLTPGERVFSLTGRIPELYVAAFGTLRYGAVFSPLFSAFGPEPLQARLELGTARVLLTTAALYRRKVAALRSRLPQLQHIIVVGGADGPPLAGDGLHDFEALLAGAPPMQGAAPTRAETPALLHFTSGTTGRPKGAVHVHEAVLAHHATARLALDLRAGDVFWCTADPGWVTGTSYGIVAPLAVGATVLVDEADFDAERWYRLLQEERVSVWYTAPTAVRMMMRIGAAFAARFDLSALRFLATVGEPLGRDAVLWSQEVFGRPFHETWWQTETGAIMIANFAAEAIAPGAMGKPFPGIEAAVVEREGAARRALPPGAVGELALRAGWPSMFRTYLGEEARYRSCFVAGWYLSGDLARVDENGYFWFVGRADDVIKSAGHLIGPHEVEAALRTHPAVAEAAVIGRPDPTIGEVVTAFVTLRNGAHPHEALRRALLAHARRQLGAAIAPREIIFAAGLPKTRSGKIVRRLLKARMLGLPEGDLSTLENEQHTEIR